MSFSTSLIKEVCVETGGGGGEGGEVRGVGVGEVQSDLENCAFL